MGSVRTTVREKVRRRQAGQGQAGQTAGTRAMPGERGQGSKGGLGGKGDGKGKGKGKRTGKENKLALAGSSGKGKVEPGAAVLRAFLIQPPPRVQVQGAGGVGSAGNAGTGGQQPRAAAALKQEPLTKKIKLESGGTVAGGAHGKGKEAEAGGLAGGAQGGASQRLLSDVFKPQSARTPAHPQPLGFDELGARGLEAAAARNLGLGHVAPSLLLPRSVARAERSCFTRCLRAVALHPATLRALLCASLRVCRCALSGSRA